MWLQKEITLRPRRRGFHLITSEIVAQLPPLPAVGLVNIFILHTSASLTINENADPDVREDLETIFNTLAPENDPRYLHTFEGSDDMPAHAKAILIGPSLTIPVVNGHLGLGRWQGIYLCEHRDHGGQRRLIVTVTGE